MVKDASLRKPAKLGDLLRPDHSSGDPTAVNPERDAVALKTVDDSQDDLAIARGVADEHVGFEMRSHWHMAYEMDQSHPSLFAL